MFASSLRHRSPSTTRFRTRRRKPSRGYRNCTHKYLARSATYADGSASGLTIVILRKTSRVLLGLQALLLAYPSLLAIPLCGASLLGSTSAQEMVTATIVLASLLAGWRMVFRFLNTGGLDLRGLHPLWWGIAGLGAATTSIHHLARLAGTPLEFPLALGSVGSLLEPGLLFLPAFFHLCVEAYVGSSKWNAA
jgi:hypothetical protein